MANFEKMMKYLGQFGTSPGGRRLVLSQITEGDRESSSEITYEPSTEVNSRISDLDGMYSECRDILQDHSKFKLISRNPIENLKKKLNNLISGINAEIGGTKFSKLVGDFQPGYFYGNVKTHKENNPLRPIISQISTPSYQVAKTLHNIISPYIPTTYSLRSTEEFIDLLNTNQTKEVPFRCPEGKLYMQTDGVSMGSPLGVLFAQAFMAEVEQRVFQISDMTPHIYCRYIDDIFVSTKSTKDLELLRKNQVLPPRGFCKLLERNVALSYEVGPQKLLDSNGLTLRSET
ncbi:uncharacterized protein LOC143034116 [Oratosquilla oratoria]|uniref:uncharacterized protein LOC143034116 n=1 Tax=Oratosquilla oratoria TaxID=337810 RepID=UPI003F76331E